MHCRRCAANAAACLTTFMGRKENDMERKKTADEGYPVYLFFEGNNFEAQKFFGAHLIKRGGEEGVMFRLWAPHARAVSVVGDFNSWLPGSHPMEKVDEKGIWEVFVAGLKEYDVYKYCVITSDDRQVYKADPYAFHTETRPSNGSKVYQLEGYEWNDEAWMRAHKKADPINTAMNIY
mgnify:FL=1